MKLPLPVIDGRIIFNARQPMPDSIPGYTQNPDDPYEWFMDYEKCEHRQEGQRYICPTGRSRVRDWCHLKGLRINPVICKNCDVRSTPRPRNMTEVSNEITFESNVIVA